MPNWSDNEAIPQDIQRVWNYLVDGRIEDAFEISVGVGMQGVRVALALMELYINGMLLDRKTDTPHKYYLVQSGCTRESSFEASEDDITRMLKFLETTRFATASDISASLEIRQIRALISLKSMEMKGMITRTSDDVVRYIIPPFDPDVDMKLI